MYSQFLKKIFRPKIFHRLKLKGEGDELPPPFCHDAARCLLFIFILSPALLTVLTRFFAFGVFVLLLFHWTFTNFNISCAFVFLTYVFLFILVHIYVCVCNCEFIQVGPVRSFIYLFIYSFIYSFSCYMLVISINTQVILLPYLKCSSRG